MGKMSHERAGGWRHKVAVNPPAIRLSSGDPIDAKLPFLPKAAPPAVISNSDLLRRLSESGVKDTMTEQAAVFLDMVGYQRALRYLPRDKENRSLKRAHELMVFDLEFQSVLMKHIGFFEIAFRTRYATAMAKARGPFAHRNPRNFSDEAFYEEFLKHYADELMRSASRNRWIASEVDTFDDLPLWSAVDTMTFGTLAKLYKNTRNKAIKDRVAGSFGTDYQTFSSWLRSLSVARNECAHFGKLLGTHLVSRPKSIKGIPARNDQPFYLVLILAKALSSRRALEGISPLSGETMLIRDIAKLMDTDDCIIKLSGIPDDWDGLIAQATNEET